jgi:signal transduction histidine kinase/Tfp pilus assembly protein PilF
LGIGLETCFNRILTSKQILIRLVFLLTITSAIPLSSQGKLDSLLISIKDLTVPQKIKKLNDFTWDYRNILQEEAIKAAELTLSLSESIDDKPNRAKSLNFLSVLFRDQGEYEKSIALSTKALDIAQTAGDWEQQAYSNNNIGTIYRLKGNYPLALSYIYKALKIFEDNEDNVGKSYCTYNIGFVYLRQNNYEKALEYLEETVRLREIINDKEGAIKARGRAADVYVELGEYDKAIKIYHEVGKAYAALGDQKSLIYGLNGIATVYEKTKNYRKALPERYNALLISRKFNFIEGIVINSSLIGVLEARLGNYLKGKAYLDSALDITNKFSSSVFRLQVYKNYSDFYELQKNYNESYKYLKLYIDEKDSIAKQEKRTVVAEVEYAYISNKKERETELIKRDLDTQKTFIKYWIGITIILVVFAIAIGFLYKSKEKANKKLTELNQLKDKFFSIVAHDLKNPFHVLINYSQILDEDKGELSKEERDQIISALAISSRNVYGLLENLLLWSRSQTNGVTVKSEATSFVKLIDEILMVLQEQAKLKNVKIIKELNYTDSINTDPDILKTVLRNLISNAIKYTTNDDWIKISSSFENNNLKITITDNGIGIDEKIRPQLFSLSNLSSTAGTSGEKGTGLGLIICREFVEKLGGKIWIEPNVPTGSRFIFTIPVSSKI